jgi:hypothetical protein
MELFDSLCSCDALESRDRNSGEYNELDFFFLFLRSKCGLFRLFAASKAFNYEYFSALFLGDKGSKI